MNVPLNPVARWNIVNLYRMRWVLTADSYTEAVRIAGEYEQLTKQPHGVERTY